MSGAAKDLNAIASRDAALLGRARRGERDAIDQLYRAHRAVALRLASRLCDERDVEDVVSEAFARVVAQLVAGAGPRSSFRAYLLTAVRHAHVDHVRRDAPHVWTDEPAGYDDAPHAPQDVSVREESRLLARAVSSLPRRWQLVLWWTLVDRRSLRDVGTALDLTPNAAAALAFRAREGLRVAYLDQHVRRPLSPDCVPWRERLPALLVGRAGADTTALQEHVDGCADCGEMLHDLRRLRAEPRVPAGTAVLVRGH
ncbi:RNA polymerase sigma factor [Nocardioides sp. CPCC 205120]|uniref:RNA polymerase sigma factor n=1 Tax=Nocardioides sp. CPCC 205120 TaxID=3406462 RepID=UPI003B51198D